MQVLAAGIFAMILFSDAHERPEKPPENPDRRLALSKKNAAAEELESVVLPLGLDPHRGDPSAEHPSREDVEDYQRAGLASWLDAQLKGADDTIAPPLAGAVSYLEKRQPTLWRVVGLVGPWRSGSRVRSTMAAVPLWCSRPLSRFAPRARRRLRRGHVPQ